jgi:Flp pilus assembly protein TadG
MSRHSRGQSIVEMAFVLPILLILIFGIIEFGYYIFAYTTVSQATRNAAEAAAQLPPYDSWLNYRSSPPADSRYPGFMGDSCVGTIIRTATSDATLFRGRINENRNIADYVTIRYPNGGNTRNLRDRGPIEVTVRYPVSGITPLFQLLRIGDGEGIMIEVTQRRSIENLGVDPSTPSGVACAKDVADFCDLYPDRCSGARANGQMGLQHAPTAAQVEPAARAGFTPSQSRFSSYVAAIRL